MRAIRRPRGIVSALMLSVGLLLATGVPLFASITANPSSVAFANQTVGTTSLPISVALTNANQDSIKIVSVTCSLAQFSYSGPSLPVSLRKGQSLAGAVVFRPNSVQTYSGSLIFTRANGSTVTIPLSGAGIPAAASSSIAPSISAQPAAQTVIVGQPATFSVTATGTAPLSYQWRKNGANISSATTSTYTTPATTAVDSGAQFSVVISNAAGSVSSAAATLTVTAPGTLSLSSSLLAFSNVNVGSGSTLPVTLTNSGGSSVTVASVSISGSGFNASGIATGQIIGVGQAATLNVTFAPAASGSVTGNANVASNASNSPAMISLSGTGAAGSYSSALSWSASTSAVIGYDVYRSAISGGPYSKLTPSLISSMSYSDTGVQAGQTYYYVVTAVDSSNAESVYSNQVGATIP